MTKDEIFGRVQVETIPLPGEMQDLTGTYTCSGRVLAAYRTAEDLAQNCDFYHVITVNDDGTEQREVFSGMIPQSKTANGIRWMCFTDNRRVLLGDYVLEAAPDLDHPESAQLLPVRYPKELYAYPGLFRHWSEIIISPDSRIIAWTMLTFSGAANFLGELVRGETEYTIENVCCISSITSMKPDPSHQGYKIPLTMRGGEIKQFINGGRSVSLVGNSDSLSDSVIEELDTGATRQFTRTSGYEETAIFSPDEKLAICMSPRFSPSTDCSVLGIIPLPHSEYVRTGIINPAYNYAIASQRIFRPGNIGPALVDAESTRREGRSHRGIDLSDPENQYVYYSPMSWAPCSTKALWNERTRLIDADHRCRLQVVKLLDKQPGTPVAAVPTPTADEIPYAIPLQEFLAAPPPKNDPYRIRGAVGEIVCSFNEETGYKELSYDNYSEDGKTFYQGKIASKCPPSMFEAGENIFRGDLTVSGEHTGRLDARLVFTQASLRDPVRLSFEPWEDGEPASIGFGSYDGAMVFVNDMLK